MAKRKPCVVPLCPMLRAKGSYVCVAHKPGYDARHRLTAARPHKYGAVSTKVDGIGFDSKAEARRWSELLILQKTGQIRNLVRQPEFALHAAPVVQTVDGTGWRSSDLDALLIGVARMDFSYEQAPDWKLIVEDVKGMDNALSRWKRKHVQIEYGIAVVLVR